MKGFIIGVNAEKIDACGLVPGPKMGIFHRNQEVSRPLLDRPEYSRKKAPANRRRGSSMSIRKEKVQHDRVFDPEMRILGQKEPFRMDLVRNTFAQWREILIGYGRHVACDGQGNWCRWNLCGWEGKEMEREIGPILEK